MRNHRPPLLPTLSAKTAFDYMLAAAGLAIGLAVIYVRFVS